MSGGGKKGARMGKCLREAEAVLKKRQVNESAPEGLKRNLLADGGRGVRAGRRANPSGAQREAERGLLFPPLFLSSYSRAERAGRFSEADFSFSSMSGPHSRSPHLLLALVLGFLNAHGPGSK